MSMLNALDFDQWLRNKFIQGVEWVIKKEIEDHEKFRLHLEKCSQLIPQVSSVSYYEEKMAGVSLQWIEPEECCSNKILYYLHGGGYRFCSTNTHRRLISRIASEAGLYGVGINYRLAPEHPFPSAVEDAVKGYEIILKKGFKPENIIVAGDSAGGGLAISLLVSLKELKMPLPRAAVCLSPWVDLAGKSKYDFSRRSAKFEYAMMKFFGESYAGKKTSHPLASPINADLQGLPPMLIQVSESELLYDDSVRLHQRALDHEVRSTLKVYPNMLHVWQAYDFLLTDANQSILHIAQFIKEQFNKTDAHGFQLKSTFINRRAVA